MKTWDDIKYLYYNIAARYHIYHPEYDIDELVDEAYIKTYPYWDTDNIPHRIHSAIQLYLKNQRIRYRYKFEIHEVTVKSVTDWESEISYEIENEDYERLKPLVEKLSFDERTLLYLKYYLDVSISEIARLYNRSHEHIRQALKSIYLVMRKSETFMAGIGK